MNPPIPGLVSPAAVAELREVVARLPLLIGYAHIRQLCPLSRDTIERAIQHGHLTPVKRAGTVTNSKAMFARAQVLAWLGIGPILDKDAAMQAAARPRPRGRPRKAKAS